MVKQPHRDVAVAVGLLGAGLTIATHWRHCIDAAIVAGAIGLACAAITLLLLVAWRPLTARLAEAGLRATRFAGVGQPARRLRLARR